MIYTIGYFISTIGLLILLFGYKSFLPSLNKLQKFAFIILSLGLLIPMLYGFILGFIQGIGSKY